jgi:hypothetical protein
MGKQVKRGFIFRVTAVQCMEIRGALSILHALSNQELPFTVRQFCLLTIEAMTINLFSKFHLVKGFTVAIK